jgi:hypothetical protein
MVLLDVGFKIMWRFLGVEQWIMEIRKTAIF